MNKSIISGKGDAIDTPLKNGNHNIQYGGTQDNVPILGGQESEGNKCSNLLRFFLSCTIEPSTFFFMFSFMLNMSCMSNLMMDKGCRNYYNYSSEICSNLSGHAEEKKNVEILANNYGLYCNILSLLAAFMMVFIAPWSDQHGRKLPLIITCIGAIVTDIGVIMCVFYFESSLNFLILSRLPAEIVGGFICFLTIVYSHAAEVTTEKNRTLKYTTIEIFFMVGISLGGFTGGMIYRYFGYIYVYITSAVLHSLSMLWVIFIVEETVGEGAYASWATKKRNFFRLDSITKSWKATIRPRENKERSMIWMYLISMCIIVLTYETSAGLGFVYAHHIYNWDPAKYNTVVTEISLSQLVLMIFLTPLFLKVFKLSDSVVGIIGNLSLMAKNAIIGLAKYHTYIYYMGQAAGFVSSFATLAVRAGISKITDKEETSLVFSFLATCEAIIPMVGTAFGTSLFNATIDIYPSVLYLTTAAFLIFPIGTFIWIYFKNKAERYRFVSINSNLQ